MNKEEVTKKIAESLRATHLKLNALRDLTGFEVYEYLTDLDGIFYVLLDLLDVPPWDADKDILFEYLDGEIDYDKMLSEIKEAQDNFNPDEYAEYIEACERLFGGD